MAEADATVKDTKFEHGTVASTWYFLAMACWKQVTAPVLWVDAADSEVLKRIEMSVEEHAARRSVFRDLRYVTIPDAGHMLHHDQPARVARLIEEFLQ